MTTHFDSIPWSNAIAAQSLPQLNALMEHIDVHDVKYIEHLFYFLNTAPEHLVKHVHASLFLDWTLRQPHPEHLAAFLAWDKITTVEPKKDLIFFVSETFQRLIELERSDDAIHLLNHVDLDPSQLFDMSYKGLGFRMLTALSKGTCACADAVAPVLMTPAQQAHWKGRDPWFLLAQNAFLRNNVELFDHLQQRQPLTPEQIWGLLDGGATAIMHQIHRSMGWMLDRHLEGSLPYDGLSVPQKHDHFFREFDRWMMQSENFFTKKSSVRSPENWQASLDLMTNIYQHLTYEHDRIKMIQTSINSNKPQTANWLLNSSSLQTIDGVIEQLPKDVERWNNTEIISLYPALSNRLIARAVGLGGQPSPRAKM